MKMTGNTILVTGGGSGIGRALAAALHARGNQVIVAGRRQEALDQTVAASPGMAAMQLDIGDPAAIHDFTSQLTAAHPKLNVLINNAGIMRPEQLATGALADAEAIITTNLLGPMRLTAALLPHFLKHASTVMNVSSGLAFVPLAMTPTYSATKAAIHSYSQSMRHQLAGTSVEVIELVPPGVQTDLMGGAENDRFMPLPAYVAEVMELLEANPAAHEICVESVKTLRNAAAVGNFEAVFQMLNGPH